MKLASWSQCSHLPPGGEHQLTLKQKHAGLDAELIALSIVGDARALQYGFKSG